MDRNVGHAPTYELILHAVDSKDRRVHSGVVATTPNKNMATLLYYYSTANLETVAAQLGARPLQDHKAWTITVVETTVVHQCREMEYPA